ncbi:MAG TPA: hypothetical protein PKY50_20400, partial [Candidatus Competibacter sp.]|nr:hypothetical protein [Candidatus Competibacter sp.]
NEGGSGGCGRRIAPLAARARPIKDRIDDAPTINFPRLAHHRLFRLLNRPAADRRTAGGARQPLGVIGQRHLVRFKADEMSPAVKPSARG